MAHGKRQAGMPGWVKGFLWAGIALLAVGAVAGLSGHGPWQHGEPATGHESGAHQS
jgi:hypothetical protein